MSISGLKKISVYDPATGTVVQLNKVSSEGDFKHEPLSEEGSKGNLVFSGYDSLFEFMAFDDTGYDQLESWMKNETEVNLVTHGMQEHLLWYEPSLITVKKDFGFKVGNRNGFTVKISKTGGIQNICTGQNLIYSLFGWADSDNNNIADGYAIHNEFNLFYTFINGAQNLGYKNALPANYNIGPVVYPISGIDLEFFLGEVLTNIPGPQSVEICNYDFNEGTIVGVKGDVTTHIKFRTPGNIYKFYIFMPGWDFIWGNGQSMNFKIPYLGLPGNSGLITW